MTFSISLLFRHLKSRFYSGGRKVAISFSPFRYRKITFYLGSRWPKSGHLHFHKTLNLLFYYSGSRKANDHFSSASIRKKSKTCFSGCRNVEKENISHTENIKTAFLLFRYQESRWPLSVLHTINELQHIGLHKSFGKLSFCYLRSV